MAYETGETYTFTHRGVQEKVPNASVVLIRSPPRNDGYMWGKATIFDTVCFDT